MHAIALLIPLIADRSERSPSSILPLRTTIEVLETTMMIVGLFAAGTAPHPCWVASMEMACGRRCPHTPLGGSLAPLDSHQGSVRPASDGIPLLDLKTFACCAAAFGIVWGRHCSRTLLSGSSALLSAHIGNHSRHMLIPQPIAPKAPYGARTHFTASNQIVRIWSPATSRSSTKPPAPALNGKRPSSTHSPAFATWSTATSAVPSRCWTR
jgi:hypothetical protein